MMTKIDKRHRKVVIPRREPIKLKDKSAELLKIAEIAVQHSGGRLRLAYNEEDESEKFKGSAQRFLKLDGRRLGSDIELYGFIGDDIVGWRETLVIFLEEIFLPLKNELPESYTKAGETLRALGESTYPKRLHKQWRALF